MPRDRRSVPGGRHSHDAPLEGRRVWDVGDWGNASGHIGRHWETVGTECLRRRLEDGTLPLVAGRRGARMVSFVDDQALQRRFAGLGLTNADALLLLPERGKVIARAIDFKWSIETATERQVAATALEALIERIPEALQDLIRQALPDFQGPELIADDGFFFSPLSRANEAARQRRTGRQLASEVVFEPVDGRTFFSALAGWPIALQLAELDRRTYLLDTVDGAEHYYRLGVGIGAARTLLDRSIFESAGEAPAPGDAPLPLAEWGWRETAAIVGWLSPQVEERRVLTRRLRDLLRPPYTLRDLLRDLTDWNSVGPDPATPAPVPHDLRVRWEPVYKRLVERHRAAILEEGRAHSRELGSESAAIERIARRRGYYQQRARRWAAEIAAA
ncbi:MAG TPA: hypothetical protein VHL09_05260 [Dehalococcoidia bacterium]|nr:hypothetical protein [Dehalococcoidia bacterium]